MFAPLALRHQICKWRRFAEIATYTDMKPLIVFCLTSIFKPNRTLWRIPVITLIAFGTLPTSTRAQQTQTQQIPRIDTFVGLTDRYRLMFRASQATDGGTVNSAQFGPNLDINIRPLRHIILHTNNSEDNTFVTFRVGYQYLKNLDRPNENRIPLQVTSRFHLFWSMDLAERNRVDLRVINHQLSWRYRNRITIQRSFSVRSFSFSPYARGEVFYDSRQSGWTKNTYSFGSIFPVRKRFELEGYYERENTTGGSPPHVNGIGATLYVYLRR